MGTKTLRQATLHSGISGSHPRTTPLGVPRKSQPTWPPSSQQGYTKHVSLLGPVVGARDTEGSHSHDSQGAHCSGRERE